MSFRTAYNSLGRSSARPLGLIRDLTPEQEARRMQDYYVRQQEEKLGYSFTKRKSK